MPKSEKASGNNLEKASGDNCVITNGINRSLIKKTQDNGENAFLSESKKIQEKMLADEVLKDFNRRREERKTLERQWQLNINYLMGNQYASVLPTGEIEEEQKDYFWQGRNVYNHIAPIIETRLAKLSRVRPIMSVRASGEEEADVKSAKLASALLNSTFSRLEMSDIIYKATLLSETFGTSFYKVIWDENGGKKIGELDGKPVHEGDVKVVALSPFDIFPDSLFHEEIEDQKSIIHAQAMHIDDVKAIFGKTLKGGDINVFTLDKADEGSGFFTKRVTSGIAHDNVLVIERYEAPCERFPQGRVVTVADGQVLAVRELPFINGEEGKRVFPFIRQVSINQAGCFFGVSIIDRLIPLQRAYNAVKNRKHEYLNRVSMGVVTVEDGSVDTDALTEDGLSPGKVLVYRQGAAAPRFMANSSVPPDFSYEESRLEQEFINISGVSEFSRTSSVLSQNMSGVALELLVEQDETRLVSSAENIRKSVRLIGKQIIRLFKQYAKLTRMMRVAGKGNYVELYYFNAGDLTSDDVVFDTENELSYTPAQKKNAIYEMLKTGLLSDENGGMSRGLKAKVLDLLGFGTLAGAQDITNLHIDKAQRENIKMAEEDCATEDFDDHELHINEHIRFLLTENFSGREKYKQRITNHLNKHKQQSYAEKAFSLNQTNGG